VSLSARFRPTVTRPLPALSAFYFHAEAGLGTPEGLLGAGLGISPTTWASAEIGGGMSDSGPQASLMLGLQLPVSERATLGASSGLSIGRNSISQGLRFDVDDPSLRANPTVCRFAAATSSRSSASAH
jgi:hypothetical protein